MNSFLFILTGFVVLTGSALAVIAPIWKPREKLLRILGVCFTATGGFLGIVIGLRSATKTDALLRSTAQILQTSGTTLNAVNQTLDTSEGVLKQTKENLDKTTESLRIVSQVALSSREAASYASGGDSYPQVFPEAVTREDGTRQIGFYFSKQGKYPLYGLTVFVGRPYKTSDGGTVETSVQARQFPELTLDTTYPIWFQPVPEENSTFYAAHMYARNGAWEEVINIQKVGSIITWRIVLFESKDPRLTPSKQVFDLAEEKFPVTERKRKIYPLTEIALPSSPRP